MAVQDKSTSSFPLVFLQPVADVHYLWTALSLHVSPFDENGCDLFSRLFNEFGLGDALNGLACILTVPNPERFAGEFGAPPKDTNLILRIPVEYCVDAARHPLLERLNKLGYGLIADGLPSRQALFSEYVESISLDCSAGIQPEAGSWLTSLRGPHIAENVPDPVLFDACRAEGFRWFSGEYPLLPSSAVTQKDAISRGRLLKLLELVSHDADAPELEALLKQDPALSYQLFKLVSSAAFGFSAHITNFTQAINLLGRRQLQRWLQLLLYARFPGDESANPLLPRAAARAAMMEALCQQTDGDRDEQDRAFIVGMFSLLDVLLAMPLRLIIEPLKLPQDIVDALMQRRGRLGRLLDVVERAEYGRIPLRHTDLVSAGVTAEGYCRGLIQAYRWASKVSHEA
ncbi:signal transduction protein [Herbaspirillum sp. meg3]|jgi:EAL and modified HD-GYP domain-containing signal transduction protein|uniref:EAL and HDOD domain-containing protein n=1 Tax=Herbaspirillum sp. meg3 TaxID=2025949 RepID=UPI000B985272|nr:HDOD domain-containing protein [Herbaspirillum sp. meg3]ASU39158.1 signal transduction protein [Herbaspirillum sp. meg3]